MSTQLSKEEKKVQRAVKKLISEEWIASTFYEQMILACDPAERETIKDLFEKNGIDEKEDHYAKLVKFAEMKGFDIPCKMSDYEMSAGESTVKQFEKWSKGKKADYYIEEAIKAEEDAIKSYSEILNDEDICQCLKNYILEFYYDEVEHLSNLNTLLLAYRVKAKINF